MVAKRRHHNKTGARGTKSGIRAKELKNFARSKGIKFICKNKGGRE